MNKKWFRVIYLIGIMILILIGLSQQIPAQTTESKTSLANNPNLGTNVSVEPKEEQPNNKNPSKSMKERSFELQAVIKDPDPVFLIEGAEVRPQGGYFGTGLRSVRLDLENGKRLFNSDNNVNGGVFNLGYFTNDYLIEYSRHVSIIDQRETFPFQNHLIDFIDIVQNNLWFFFSYHSSRDLYFHYGLGAQISQVLLKETSTGFVVLQREGSILLGGGISYFINPNYFVQYRFAQGFYSSLLSPTLTGENVDNILDSSQIHTIFLQYYLSF